MTAKANEPAVTRHPRGGVRGGFDLGYGYVAAFFVLALLVIVAQSGLAAAGESNKWLGGLHALDGMVILLLSLWLAIAARRRRLARHQPARPAVQDAARTRE